MRVEVESMCYMLWQSRWKQLRSVREREENRMSLLIAVVAKVWWQNLTSQIVKGKIQSTNQPNQPQEIRGLKKYKYHGIHQNKNTSLSDYQFFWIKNQKMHIL